MRLPGMIISMSGEALSVRLTHFDDTELDPEKDFQESVESSEQEIGLVLGTAAAERLAILLSERDEKGDYGPLPASITKPADLGHLVLEKNSITTVAPSALGLVVGSVKGQRTLNATEIFEAIVNEFWSTPADAARSVLGQSTFDGNNFLDMALVLLLNFSYGPKGEGRGVAQDQSDDGAEIPF